MAIPDEPLTRGEQYLAKTAGQDVTLPDEPLTRMEQYLAKIAGQDVDTPDAPLTRMEQYLDYIAENGGGGGGDITLETLTVSQNGTTNAPEGTAYNKVVTSVPVPTLESKSVSANGTYTPESGKAWNEVVVNVQAGGNQTISFLDWAQETSSPDGLFQLSLTRIACKHILYKCQSVSIPSGVEIAFGAATFPKLTTYITAGASFIGFWSGSAYTNSFTWFNSQTIDFTNFANWENYYFVMFLRHPNNSNIAPSEGNGVVVTYDFSDGAIVK